MQTPTSTPRFALTRGQPIPVTAATSYALVDMLRDAGFTIDQRRLDRVFHDPKGPIHGAVTVHATPTEIQGLVRGVYNAVIRLQGGQVTDCDCDCPDWFQSGGKAARVPCKHILATAVDTPWPIATPPAGVPAPQPTAPPPEPAQPAKPTPAPDADTQTFNQRVRRAIGQAVAKLADQVESLLQAGETPFLIGPTGCGKTSAVRLVATRNGWGLEEVAGASSFADADLVGIKTNQLEHTGVFARAFRRARRGETVVVFLDELTRFNVRVPDLLMRPLLPISPEVAWSMQIPAVDGEAVRVVEAPVWGVEWAPAQRTPLVLAANPWGSALDPALVRRATPVAVNFDPAVAELFRDGAKTVIETSWKLVTEGQLPLPVEYQALGQATSARDTGFVGPYLARLLAVDRPAAEGFKKLLESMGVKL